MNNKSIIEKPDLTSFDEKIDLLLRTGIKSNYPLAIWRAGDKAITSAICQISNDSYLPEEIESAHPGFIMAPFKKDAQKKYIKADVILSSEVNQLLSSPTFSDQGTFEQFKNNFEDNDLSVSFDYTESLENRTFSQMNKTEYSELVNNTVSIIKSGKFQKIVPSRTRQIEVKAGFNPIKEFNKLCQAYPNAFVSLIYIPEDGLWLGATPELLISIENNKKFRTVALAGTQSIPSDFQLSKAAWMQKDIEEQALVSRYIINCFKKIRLREFDEYGPKTARAGNLIHLKTEFTVDMEYVNFPQLGTVMLDLLHPTSAVCGMPMLPAVEFLRENENYDREYYSGYIGPVNISDETNIYVNLRCMKIMKDNAVLFAGGGITEDSEAEDEWMETEMKFQTLLNIIQQ